MNPAPMDDTPRPINPLISDPWPNDTLDRCRAVLEVLRSIDPERTGIGYPHFGVSLILDLVDEAIGFEQAAGRPWASKSGGARP